MGNWLAYPFGDPRINTLTKKYGVAGIPRVVVIDAKTCKIIEDNARTTITKKKGDKKRLTTTTTTYKN